MYKTAQICYFFSNLRGTFHTTFKNVKIEMNKSEAVGIAQWLNDLSLSTLDRWEFIHPIKMIKGPELTLRYFYNTWSGLKYLYT